MKNKKIIFLLILGSLLFISGVFVRKYPTPYNNPLLKDASIVEEHNVSVSKSPHFTKTEAKISKVLDGDTIKAIINNKEETIRLIGIDTPEIADPRKPIQCFGKEAKNKAKEMLSGKTVVLESDPTQANRDKYGRLLRYVFLNDLNFNKLMISEGYAHEFTYNIPYKYQTEFKNAERIASEEKKGLWKENICKNFWNNTGDHAFWYNENGELVSDYQY